MGVAKCLAVFCVLDDNVFNAYCVQDVDSYIHRSGRTGRAGRSGISVVLYQPSEMAGVGTVERVAVSYTGADCVFV